MATPNEKLAESLDVLKALQESGRRVFRSRMDTKLTITFIAAIRVTDTMLDSKFFC